MDGTGKGLFYAGDFSGCTAADVSCLGALPDGQAVKISTGEPGGHNFLQPSLIRELVEELQGTIVECNTAYAGRRNTTGEHWKAIAEHGFLDIAPCDIMDEDGELSIPVNGGKHLTENFVGAHLQRYDSMLLLSHFKGHAMGGFGGALKNMSIGVASAEVSHTDGTAVVTLSKPVENAVLRKAVEDKDYTVTDIEG